MHSHPVTVTKIEFMNLSEKRRDISYLLDNEDDEEGDNDKINEDISKLNEKLIDDEADAKNEEQEQDKKKQKRKSRKRQKFTPELLLDPKVGLQSIYDYFPTVDFRDSKSSSQVSSISS